ncbi:MAG: chemotaxis protein CheA, partial [Anaerolineae bacterium]|nr:chemotaxis protein CheA [Anaerolineae bacterium]
TIAHIGRITDQLQKEVMSIRMLPVANVFHKFPRMVRDLANKFNKKIDLAIEGEDTELDRSVIEEITDPLIHLIRNSLDHGIEDPAIRRQNGKDETGHILLAARHEQGRIVLTVEDDGSGINVDKVKASAVQKGIISEADAAAMSQDEGINLIFASGLSTARSVSDISGRGVGLDIVRNNIQRLNGSITIETWPGKGTRFQITLPLTLAIVPTLLVKVGPCIFAIPLVTVLETLRVKDQDIKTVNGYPVIVLRDRVLPLMNLADIFRIPSTGQGTYHHIVVVGTGKLQMGLIVDTLLGQEEVVVKSLGPLVGEINGIASAAILGDGQIILILDIQGLSRHTGGGFHDKKG